MKLKLNPSAQIKRRYLLIKASSKEDVSKAILDYIGILGWARASPLFVKNSSNEIILAIDKKEINNIRAALEIFPGKIRVVSVSGTLKGLNK